MHYVVWNPLYLNSETAKKEFDTLRPYLLLVEIDITDDLEKLREKLREFADSHVVITFNRPILQYGARARKWLAAVRPPLWQDIFADEMQENIRTGGHQLTEPSVHSGPKKRCSHVLVSMRGDGYFADDSLVLLTAIQQLDLTAPNATLRIAIAARVAHALAYTFETRQTILSQCVTMVLSDLGYISKGVDNDADDDDDDDDEDDDDDMPTGTWMLGFRSLEAPGRQLTVHIMSASNYADTSGALTSLSVDEDCIVHGAGLEIYNPNPLTIRCISVAKESSLDSEKYCDQLLAKLPGLELDQYDAIEREILRAVIAPSLDTSGRLTAFSSEYTKSHVKTLAMHLLKY